MCWKTQEDFEKTTTSKTSVYQMLKCTMKLLIIWYLYRKLEEQKGKNREIYMYMRIYCKDGSLSVDYK